MFQFLVSAHLLSLYFITTNDITPVRQCGTRCQTNLEITYRYKEVK